MCNASHAEERAAFRSTICSATPHPQHRKINCTLQNALAEKVVGCDVTTAKS
jgi:hypothetical protein